MTAKEIILGAHDLLVREGWTQGIGQNYNGCRCLVRALNDSTPTEFLTELDDAKWHLWKNLKDGFNIGPLPLTAQLMNWNDATLRTEQEVLDLLTETAKEL